MINNKTQNSTEGLEPHDRTARRVRADAQRNIDSLLQAAMEVFTTSGVDAPVREIAEKAGVGVGTLYRHFPQRADLIAAVFRREIDACADASPILADEHAPFEALARWLGRYAQFIAAKRGLGAALHSGDPAFDTLPAYFDRRLRPALQMLLERAVAAGAVCTDVEPNDLLRAVSSLCMAAQDGDSGQTQRMVALLIDGCVTTRDHRRTRILSASHLAQITKRTIDVSL